MIDESVSRVTELFHQALELSPDERVRFLQSACGGDAELRSRVEALLQADDDTFLAEPAASESQGAALLEQKVQRLTGPAAVGERLGAYELTEVLGRGSMGWVFRGRHVLLGREVALKLLAPEFVEDEELVARFFAEARVVNAIRHPNIIEVIDFIEQTSPRRVGFVMKLLEGLSLSDYVQGRKLSFDQTLDIAGQLAGALAAVHAGGIVHRDLKPGNVFVCGQPPERPSVIVLDFGVAKMAERSGYRTATGELLGTPAYMAPEQLRGANVGPAADIYAWGLIVVEMLRGAPVFTGSTLGILRAKMGTSTPDSAEVDGLPSPLGAILQQSLAIDPAERPTSEEIGAVFASAAASSKETIDPTPVSISELEWARMEAEAAVRALEVLGAILSEAGPLDSPVVKRVLDRGLARSLGGLSEEPRARSCLLRAASEVYHRMGCDEDATRALQTAAEAHGPATEPETR